MWGSDQAASVEPQGLARLVRDIRAVEAALGDGVKRVYDERGRRDAEAAPRRPVIRVLALDIDGVLTNGEVRFDEDGRESKALFFRDIDAVFAAKREGLRIVLVTASRRRSWT